MIDWRWGDWQSHSQASFDAPGIGHGVITCQPDTQWVRFFPNDLGRETAMMNWTFKDWGTFSENAVREADKTPFSGPDFSEGMNKFTPPEKTSQGYFVGLISDRLGFNDSGGAGNPPTSLELHWDWDFSDPSNARCFVTATIVSDTDSSVKSLSVNWRGDAAAPGHDSDSITMPGVGDVTVKCPSGTGGDQRLMITPESANEEGVFDTYQGSVEDRTTLDASPYYLSLPNNGMITANIGTVANLILTSRYKTNDDHPDRNFCYVAAQLAPTGGS